MRVRMTVNCVPFLLVICISVCQIVTFKRILKEFAHKTGHPEIEYAPLLFVGESRTGWQGGGLASDMPQRMIAWGSIVATPRPQDIADQARLVPGMTGLLYDSIPFKGRRVQVFAY